MNGDGNGDDYDDDNDDDDDDDDWLWLMINDDEIRWYRYCCFGNYIDGLYKTQYRDPTVSRCVLNVFTFYLS